MIIRFDNLDDENYSGQYVFDQNGFHHANYDYRTTAESITYEEYTGSSSNLPKNCFGFLPNKPFAYLLENIYESKSYFWTSFKVTYSDGFFDIYNYETVDSSLCETENNFSNYVFDGFVDCWTSGKVFANLFSIDGISLTTFVKYQDRDCNYFLPVLGFKNSINYPRFRIYATEFDKFTSDFCKFYLFLHIFNFDNLEDHNFVRKKTVKIGCFGFDGSHLYFENYYGERLYPFYYPDYFFDLTGFFSNNTVIDYSLSEYLFSKSSQVPLYNINAFGDFFAFEIKEEDFGDIMSAIDCQCLTNAINSLNNTLESLFKIEDSNICDIFVNTMAECFGVGTYPDNFKGLGQLFSNTFLRGNNLDKSVFRTLLDIDFADSFSSAFNLLSGAGSVFTNNAINPANYRSIYDDFHDSFYNADCGSWFIESFNEAFNLTNCQGSVFKANDNIWNDEDTLAGIWYKVLDYEYLMDLNSRVSPFYTSYTSSGRLFNVGLSSVLGRGLFNGVPSGSSANVFNTSANQKFSDVLKIALFTNTDSYQAIRQNSVFQFGSADNIKLFNHACDVNPNSIKFCESVSQPAIPVEISSPVQISQPEDEFGEPVPFKMDWKPLLDLLSEALFCQFGNQDLDPRHSWGYSVFNKLLYPLHPEGCDDKVGLPELDFSEGFVPDNIFVNSNGLIARFNSEIYK